MLFLSECNENLPECVFMLLSISEAQYPLLLFHVHHIIGNNSWRESVLPWFPGLLQPQKPGLQVQHSRNKSGPFALVLERAQFKNRSCRSAFGFAGKESYPKAC